MSFWLVMQTNDGNERPFAVQKTTITIGRENNCDLRVPLPAIEQKHCQIVVEGDRAKLIDLQTQNGTFHNGQRVAEAVLAHEDTLTIGPVTFVVRVKGDATPANGSQPMPQVPEIVIERLPASETNAA